MSRLLLIPFILIISGNCTNSKNQKSDKAILIDTVNSVNISEYWITPKPSFEFNSLGNSNGDTLDLITCCDYSYFPFGKLEEKQDLKSSLLESFEIYESQKDTSTITFEEGGNGYFLWYERLKIKSGLNFINLYFENNPDDEKHSYITGGEVITSDVILINGVKIGMDKEDFISLFFDYFPNELLNKYKVITFFTCVDDLRHIYTFENNRLISIEFKKTY